MWWLYNETHVHPRTPSVKSLSRQGAADAGECRISLVARGSGTDGEVGEAGVRRVERELDGTAVSYLDRRADLKR
jgi:hypothetical protein